MDLKVKILCVCVFMAQVSAFPRTVTDRNSFVVRPSSDNFQRDAPNGLDNYQQDAPGKKEGQPTVCPGLPKIYKMHIDSNITNRFAHTLITSKVRNCGAQAQEAFFSIVLPKKAFISNFVMSLGGKRYDAYVKEKQHAKQLYDAAVAGGQGAGLVAASARDSNRFTVSINVEPASKVIFHLTYEQLLERKDHQYELVINIHPKQPVKDLSVSVNIKESQPLQFVRAPPIRSGTQIGNVAGDLDPRAAISHFNANSAMVKFSPNLERQKDLAKTLGTNVDQGLSGQFVVQYDVERNSVGGEILLQDGYFVHFFAPPGVAPLPKYILFVLDTSGSMSGSKMNQMKAAMKTILAELRSGDKFHLIDFDSVAKVLDLHSTTTVQYPSINYVDSNYVEDITLKKFANSYDVTSYNIQRANTLIDNLDDSGGTNIADALKVALYLVDEDKKSYTHNANLQPMIIFLTDGEASVGVTKSTEILSRVQRQNIHSVPIYSLSFGDGADRNQLQKLSLQNSGFARHIYEAADASLQLQDFYKQISSPMMSNVTFKYVDDAKELTKTEYPILFKGTEIVVSGQLGKNSNLPTISARGANGTVQLVPQVEKPVARLERLWAYLTIQQLFDDMARTGDNAAYEKKLLDLAIKYSFVTPISSLVVVKPNATDTEVEPVAADKSSDLANSSPGLSLPLTASEHDYDYDYVDPDDITTTTTTTTPKPIPTTPKPKRIRTTPTPKRSRTTTTRKPIRSTTTPNPIPTTTTPNRILTTTTPKRIATTTTPKPIPTTTTPQRVTTTTTPIPETTTSGPIEELKETLPWLNGALIGDTVFTSDGTYKLWLNETSTDFVSCPVTPTGGDGLCKLIHECPELHHLFTNVYIFQQYYCEMRGLAAVCCPFVGGA